jgi:hypothetical protein
VRQRSARHEQIVESNTQIDPIRIFFLNERDFSRTEETFDVPLASNRGPEIVSRLVVNEAIKSIPRSERIRI